jgi:cytochrome c biogenesis protein CcdA
MLGVAALVAGIAIVDSLNPGTIGPALVLAVSAKPVRRILEFAAGFFVVNVAGGALIVLGPGRWLFDAIPSPSGRLEHVLMVAGGAVLLAGAAALLVARDRLTRPKYAEPGAAQRRSSSAFLFGAGLALAELPTAFHYFAALAAIEAGHLSVAGEVSLIVLFNLLFLAPLLVIGVLIAFFPSAWENFIEPFRGWMSAHWPQLLAAILGAGGVALVVFGLAGLST